MKMKYLLPVALAAIVFVCLPTMFGADVQAQEFEHLDPANRSFITVVEVGTRVKSTPKNLIDRFTAAVDPATGAMIGPVDIIVGTTDKGANGIKYNNVPFVLQGDGFIAFPNGDTDGGKPVYIITSNYTVRFK